MRILFLSENFPPERNAPASNVYERAVYWVKWGHEVTVVTSAPNFPEGKLHEGYRNRWYQVEIKDGIRVVRVKTFIAPNQGAVLRTFDFLSFMAMSFLASLFQPRPDVVVATSPQFFTAVAGWGLSFVRRLPFVFELRDLWPASVTAVGAMRPNVALRMLERLELFLYRQADGVIAFTQAFKGDLVRRGIDARKIRVIVNGVDLSRYGPRDRDTGLAKELDLDGRFVVGYIGTHGMAHGLSKILDAAELLLPDDRIRFLFVGAGAERDDIIKTAEQRRLTNVVFVPAQPKERMPAFWSVCDVALIPLRNLPLFTTVIPSKIFEAMGMGIPLLLTVPDGEASRIVREAGSGVIVPPEDAAAVAAAIRELYKTPCTLAEFRKAARSAASLYTRERQAENTLTMLDEVTKNARKKAV